MSIIRKNIIEARNVLATTQSHRRLYKLENIHIKELEQEHFNIFFSKHLINYQKWRDYDGWLDILLRLYSKCKHENSSLTFRSTVSIDFKCVNSIKWLHALQIKRKSLHINSKLLSTVPIKRLKIVCTVNPHLILKFLAWICCTEQKAGDIWLAAELLKRFIYF